MSSAIDRRRAILPETGFPVICVETRHMRAVLKTLLSQKLRMLLTHRQLLLSKAIALENDLRGTLRNFGLKVGMVGTVRFKARIDAKARPSEAKRLFSTDTYA
jgi:transposase